MTDNNKFDLDKAYQDHGGLTEKKLNFGLWYVERRGRLRLALIIFLVVISILSWGTTIYSSLSYIFKGMKEDDLLVRELIQAQGADHQIFLRSAPLDLSFYPVKILKAGDKYDFLAQVSNANNSHWGEIEYYFLVNGKEVGAEKGFIMPGESKYFLALGKDFTENPYMAQFIIKKVAWHRINRHDIPDWENFKNTHADITISNSELNLGELAATPDKVNFGHLKFEAQNRTAYNYSEVNFIILLQSGMEVIGVNTFKLPQLMSGENKKIELSWPDVPMGVTQIMVMPEINFMSKSAYVKFEGGIGEEK